MAGRRLLVIDDDATLARLILANRSDEAERRAEELAGRLEEVERKKGSAMYELGEATSNLRGHSFAIRCD